MKTGTELILAERHRQINAEGWTAAHDDRHANQSLQRAAEAYHLSAEMYIQGFKSFRPPECWPWSKRWWKPSNPIRDLTKAGALWLAEIDRIKRLSTTTYIRSFLNTLRNKVQKCAERIDELNASKQ